jgi:hypothetical protein
MARNFKPRKPRKWRKPGIGAIRIDEQGRKVYWECQHMTVTDHEIAASGKPCPKCNPLAAEAREKLRGKFDDMYRRGRRAPGSFESNSR